MLTPIDIQSKVFRGGIGYERKDVDNFMAQIVDNYESLYKEHQELNKKIEVMNTALSQYKTIEKSLQKALLLAQKTSEDIKNQAHASAKIIEDEARNKASLIVVDAKGELEMVHRKTVALMQQYELYKTQFKQLAKTQVQLLQSDVFNLSISNIAEAEYRPEQVKTVKAPSTPKVESESNVEKKNKETATETKKETTK